MYLCHICVTYHILCLYGSHRLIATEETIECCQILTYFCRGCQKEVSDKDFASPLFLSVKCGKAEAVKVLIQRGCDITTCDKDGKTTVYWAAQEGHRKVLTVRR